MKISVNFFKIQFSEMHGREGLKTLHDHPLSINLCAFDINYKFMKKPLFGKF